MSQHLEKDFSRFSCLFHDLMMHFSSETGGGVAQVVTFRTICVQSVQDQVEWGFEQPGVAEGVTAHGREVGKK